MSVAGRMFSTEYKVQAVHSTAGLEFLVVDDRPGEPGHSFPWEGWSQVFSYFEEVSGRVA